MIVAKVNWLASGLDLRVSHYVGVCHSMYVVIFWRLKNYRCSPYINL